MNALTFPILRLLADGKFHSGEALAQHFKVTRTTIWSAIQHAQNLGIDIFSVRGRGYKLPTAVEFLNQDEVLRAIGEQRAWFNLQILDEVKSTNTFLMQQSAKGAAHVTCVAANLQTNGKGRRGRTWVSHLGASLTFSLLWRFQCGAAALSGLSLAVGVALIRAFNSFGINNVQLKWPNDVLVDGKKLAGILIELQGDMDGPSAAVIGIGINLNLPEKVLKNIDQPAIDLAHASTSHIPQSTLLGIVLKHLAEVLSQFELHGFTVVRDEWTQYHAYHQKPVRMLMPDGREVQGVVSNVAEDGILLVDTALGLQRFSAGEISLRST
ncbi:MAG TPA: biotin--[acetyl-CoA-carboxylase] ligase [Methylotenera sp.]|nr:biotin--[acetyl-CoA-carboxylase] ligase [Methylotenera sp.]HPH06472.1 biotin--[acetyl-CoA-carboxylase] ligase [Methylotenera sp.]HPN01233.1 biotin--[acetyl-CoA-carboxylase] ligase [Methylotenera sp.]